MQAPQGQQPTLLVKIVFAAILWSVIMVAGVWHEAESINSEAETIAGNLAKVALERDALYFNWNASHGGLYAPVAEGTLPDPYLSHVPERDIVTPSGRQLTLVNPSYMIRQASESTDNLYRARVHIVGLKPTGPESEPDEWERDALKQIAGGVSAGGVSEVSSVADIGRSPYMRLMRPLFAEKACLKCHGGQGYDAGDVMGGISASILMLHTAERETEQIISMLVKHFFIWVLGIFIISAVGRRFLADSRKLSETEQRLKRTMSDKNNSD